MTSRWSGNGPIYEVAWGHDRCRLDLGAAQPGLIDLTNGQGPVLGLQSLVDSKRQDDNAFAPTSLRAFESRFDFIEALYVPEGWHSLRVRARWSATAADASLIDLEVQLQADTVDELTAVRARVVSVIGPHAGSNPVVAAFGSGHYLEMSHPDDTIARNSDRSDRITTSLFGHDLERGVVLRGRLRGIFLASRPDAATVAKLYNEFLNAPLPLGP